MYMYIAWQDAEQSDRQVHVQDGWILPLERWCDFCWAVLLILHPWYGQDEFC
jgi:hypothetical protein